MTKTKTMRKSKNLARSLLVASVLTSGLAVKINYAEDVDRTPHGAVEFMTGNQSSVLDTKVFGSLTEKAGYFGRAITTLDYEAKMVNPFAFIDVNYKVGAGFNFVYETQFIDLQDGTLITPRVGFETFRDLGSDLSLYLMGSVNVPTDRDPLVNGELVSTLRYSPSLGKGYNAVAQIEAVTNFGEQGLNFASQNFRLGINHGSFEVGAALNLNETMQETSHNIGGYFSWSY